MLHPTEAKPGLRVVYLGDGAYPAEIERADKVLRLGELYTITRLFIDGWGTYVYLEGVPGKSFRCSMFADAKTGATPRRGVTEVVPPAPKKKVRA